MLSEEEEAKYLLKREWSPLKDMMPLGERIELDGKVILAHHIDD